MPREPARVRSPAEAAMVEILVVVALIALNAFFAVSEMALMTSRKLRL
jgi:CBS domain containing-hemolysin-like protein